VRRPPNGLIGFTGVAAEFAEALRLQRQAAMISGTQAPLYVKPTRPRDIVGDRFDAGPRPMNHRPPD
jgi:hypothetical protein